jgi:rod shape-determining protein MreC
MAHAPRDPRAARDFRPGFSQRARYGFLIAYILAFGGFLFGLLLLYTAYLDPTANRALRGILSDITSPISRLGRSATQTLAKAPSSISSMINAGERNRILEAEHKQEETKLVQLQTEMLDNARLKSLLHLATTEPKGQEVIAVHLISSTGSSSRRYAMIDKGALQRITIGAPVRAPEGLVGQVEQVGVISSRILLISDTGAVVPVKRASDGQVGTAVGNGDGSVTIRPAHIGNGTLYKPGDIFVTSGAGGVYQPGIPVAIAISNEQDGVRARLYADPTALDYALVEPVFFQALPEEDKIQIKGKKR